MKTESSLQQPASSALKKSKRGFAKLPEIATPQGMDKLIDQIKLPMQELENMMTEQDQEDDDQEIDGRFSMKLV